METPKFEKQESPDHCWVVAYDTVCDGEQAVTNDKGEICLMTKAEADAEVDDAEELEKENFEEAKADGEYDEDEEYLEGSSGLYAVHMDEYFHGRKFFVYTEGDELVGHVEGSQPLKQ